MEKMWKECEECGCDLPVEKGVGFVFCPYCNLKFNVPNQEIGD